MTYTWAHLNADCMDLFSYFAGEAIEAMAAATKTSLEKLKDNFIEME